MKKKVVVVVQVKSAEVIDSEATLALSFSILLVKCLIIRLGRSALGQTVCNLLGGCLFMSVLAIWCISLLDDARYSFSVRLAFSCVHKF